MTRMPFLGELSLWDTRICVSKSCERSFLLYFIELKPRETCDSANVKVNDTSFAICEAFRICLNDILLQGFPMHVKEMNTFSLDCFSSVHDNNNTV